MGKIEQFYLYRSQEDLVFKGETPSTPIWPEAEMEWFDFITKLGSEQLLRCVNQLDIYSPQLHRVFQVQAIKKAPPPANGLLDKLGFRKHEEICYGSPTWLVLKGPLTGFLGNDLNTQRGILTEMQDTLPLTVSSVAVRPMVDPQTGEGEPGFPDGFVQPFIELLSYQGVAVDGESFLKNSEAYKRILR